MKRVMVPQGTLLLSTLAFERAGAANTRWNCVTPKEKAWMATPEAMRTGGSSLQAAKPSASTGFTSTRSANVASFLGWRPLYPQGKKHGRENPEGSHAGDLPDLVVGPDGTAQAEVLVAHVTLDPTGATSLLQAEGTALVIHANPDDQKTDPAGNAGARIACGVIPK
jgi:hypothetical protein